MRMIGKLIKVRDLFALAKFHFDTGITFLTFVNFSLLIVAASSKFQELWHVTTMTIWLTLVPAAMFGTWFFGFVLDKYVKYQRAYFKEANDRVPQFDEILQAVKAVDARLDKLEVKING